MTDDRPLRFLVLTPDAYAGYGGIAQAARDLLQGLAAMPEVGEVVCLSRSREPWDPSALPEKLHWRAPAGGSRLSLLHAFLRLLCSGGRYDLILVTHINLLPLAWLLRRLRGGKLAVVLHGVEAWRPQRRILIRPLLAGVDAFLAVSAFTRQRFLAWAPVAPEAVKLHPNCVDLERFSPGSPEPGFLDRYDLRGKRVLLLVARLSPIDAPNKGIDQVLQLLPRLLRAHRDLVFAVAGKGADRARLEAKAEALGVSGQVRFLGFVPDSDKADLYRAASAYVMPGRIEGFGLVYLEAMASGVPVLGSTRDASQEVIAQLGFGEAVDPDDEAGLLTGIEAVLARPRGRRPAEMERYSLQAYQARGAALLRGLLGRGEV